MKRQRRSEPGAVEAVLRKRRSTHPGRKDMVSGTKIETQQSSSLKASPYGGSGQRLKVWNINMFGTMLKLRPWIPC
ncbi:hypothetical protein VNO77_03693 [Canavalia gladiata]|uniref:Uncharacterized protein n=1 Tax=Canavalia gladiata TaxID=3824 RepID=A0AAN9R724_CANGL